VTEILAPEADPGETPDQAGGAEEAPADSGEAHVNDGDPIEEPTEGTGDVPDEADAEEGS